MAIPIAMMANVMSISGHAALLCTKGMRRVRIMWTMNVCESNPSMDHPLWNNVCASDVGTLLGNIHGRIHRDADVRLTQCSCIIDAITQESDRIVLFLKKRDNLCLLVRSELCKENLSLDTMTRLEEALEISLVYPNVSQ